MLAKHFSAHTVLCVEPVLTNVEIIHKNKPENMRVVHGGLGETYGFDSYPSSLDQQKGSIHVQIGALQIYKKHRRAQERSPFPIYPPALVRRSDSSSCTWTSKAQKSARSRRKDRDHQRQAVPHGGDLPGLECDESPAAQYDAAINGLQMRARRRELRLGRLQEYDLRAPHV